MSHACGVCHPALVSGDNLEILDGQFGSKTVRQLFGYEEGWTLPTKLQDEEITRVMAGGGLV